MIRVELPFPAPELFPNRSKGRHWTTTANAKAQAVGDAYTLTYQAVSKHTGEWYPLGGAIPLTITFYPPDKRHRDLDNCLSACKSLLDGVATALTVNDKRFSPITLKRGEPVKGGSVLVEVGT